MSPFWGTIILKRTGSVIIHDADKLDAYQSQNSRRHHAKKNQQKIPSDLRLHPFLGAHLPLLATFKNDFLQSARNLLNPSKLKNGNLFPKVDFT